MLRKAEMAGSHDAAGRPSPLTKTIKCDSLEKVGLIAGEKVWDIGADGLLGMMRREEEGEDRLSDPIIADEELCCKESWVEEVSMSSRFEDRLYVNAQL